MKKISKQINRQAGSRRRGAPANVQSHKSPQPPSPFWLNPAWGAPLLVAASIAAYSNSFSVPFLFDDSGSIAENPTIMQLSALRNVFSPPMHTTVEGRPLVNFTLAINYAAGGLNTWGYHFVNLFIHISAVLALYGIVRRTLLQPRMSKQFGSAALPLALMSALLWALHPLQTEAVTYIVQRAESLVSLFYLLTLYCFIRASANTSQPPSFPQIWKGLTVVACLLGMASKEVMVSAPLIVLLYDRTFIAGTFRIAWRQRRAFYSGLFATWLLLAILIIQTGSRSGTAGFGPVGVLQYAEVQCWAIPHYLRLAVWPHPLVFDYGIDMDLQWPQAIAGAAMLLLLLCATVWALLRNNAAGFAGACFFAILAPSSSFIPVFTEAVSEHRMYLPLAAGVVLFVLSLYRLFGRGGLLINLLLAAALGMATFARNTTYHSALTIWGDALENFPRNSRAYLKYAIALEDSGNLREARAASQAALEISPENADNQTNMATALSKAGHLQEARPYFQAALRIDPNSVNALNNYGSALLDAARYAEALPYFQKALQINSNSYVIHYNCGATLERLGQLTEASMQYQAALDLCPDFFQAKSSLMAVASKLSHHPNAPL